jgi:hypothetical protein
VNEDNDLVTRLLRDPDQQQEWLRQNNLMFGGLLGAGAVLVQPLVNAASLGSAATISVVAFSIAMPLLAALLLLNHQEAFRQRASRSRVVDVAKAVAQLSAFVGVVAAFWSIVWMAGLGILASAIVAVFVHSAGYSRLELEPK